MNLKQAPSELRTVVKNSLPLPLKKVLWKIKRLFVHPDYDPHTYWKERAMEAGQAKVLWGNETYNRCYREFQKAFIGNFLPEINTRFDVLDIGCGIGAVAKIIEQLHPKIYVDGLDFPEMIEIAKTENPSERIRYIAINAEEYNDAKKTYDLIIASASLSAIRDVNKLRQTVTNCTKMLKADGQVLMIEPFHRWKYLARARFSSGQMVDLMDSLGFQLTQKSGVLFWPYRDWLANSDRSGEDIRKKFAQGERLLAILGKHLWADHKILSFTRKIGS